ncbi:hypothetical protein [Fimbriiglobus ruber]|uniref:Glycosyltransferase RgtA/B/C/D-like domain-containing protein n=1 Tax=Fimbriiglobus ruber TaxID=1908690 RepID=A0A225E4I4_9BACT|nr:hypothetical protein [Fimbriiglobus ruber]OWK46674.1 hypothetical protein FRUB_00373 [Fimbriiglobus ruber]
MAPAVFLGFWLLLLIGGRSSFFHDPGTFWHVKVGEKILADGFFRTDPYTFTFAGQRWIPNQWLGEVTMAAAHRVGGFDALLACSAALLAAVFAVITVRLIRTGVHPIAVLILVGLALAASSSHFHVRPHLATIVGTAVTMAALLAVDGGRVSVRGLWWLVPVFLVWTNTHGGVLGGLTTLALAAAGWVGFRVLGLRSPIAGWYDFAHLTGVGLACVATFVVTPYGADLPRAWFDIMSLSRLPDYIQEHSRTDFTNPSAWPVLVLSGVYLFVLTGLKPREWRVAWLVPLFWMAQAYLRVRHAPLFAVAACLAVADAWPATRWAATLGARRPDLYNRAGVEVRWGLRGVAALACVVVAMVLQAGGIRLPVIGAGWARLDPAVWPMESLAALKQNEPTLPADGHIFNDYTDGGFLIYHTPGYRVFVDDRCELFGDDWLVRFVEAGGHEPTAEMAEWQEKYGPFRFALTRTGTYFDQYFAARKDEWEVVSETPTANFYRRK